MKLEGKAAVVTGGAKGMGRAICLALAGEGAAVAVNYATSQAEAEEVVRAIAANGGQAMAVRADVGKDAEARQLIETAAQCFGRLDILVNNAGYTQRVPHRELDLLTDALMDRVLAVNTKG
ncbi:MAG TPA: SDR family NAD(P)-dependent oxidoreductase, partial [Chthonomonadaceae bacterium]|nr:SDR family NAD(P)-dependent oxidoreductase [Chthonomonadaceae bacterium]